MLIIFYTLSYFFFASLYPSMVGLTLESFPTRARGTGGAFVLGGGVWGGIMVMGLLAPRFAEAYGVPTTLMIHAGFMALGWIALLFVKRVRPGQMLEEVAI